MTHFTKHFFTEDNFYKKAQVLRDEFEANFRNPKANEQKRFVWDYWFVKDQYTLLRTPAYYYFSEKIYKDFHNQLLDYGRKELGCYNITPPWMSYYIHGCEQKMHADIPHGPWAFVYSLTPWKEKRFTGGETFILKPQALDYWRNFETYKGVEEGDLLDCIPALFNRLTVFDPRLPHGVKQVQGTMDPLEARLVIHGWFTDPEPYVLGPLTRKQATESVNKFLQKIDFVFDEYPHVHGTLTLRFKVTPQGRVKELGIKTNTLRSLLGDTDLSVQNILKVLQDGLKESHFPKAKESTWVTLPILFRF